MGALPLGGGADLKILDAEMQLNTGKHSHNFWIGNVVLAVAMLTLFFMGPLSDALGIWAAVLWMGLAALGMALVMSDKRDEPPASD